MPGSRPSPPVPSESPARDAAALDGVILIDKPAGMTSARVVDHVKRALGLRRIGHTGTLDPMATGVLPLCLGEATKIAGYLLAEDKGYEAELLLGVETDTLDAEGTVTARAPEAAAAVTEAQVREALAGFVGPGEQVPPMFSALKHRGRRLYDLARAGETVERPPRPIVIHEIALRTLALPRVGVFVHCSKGTYVRSLVADLGRVLGCGAHLTALRRTRSGAFTLDRALPLAELTVEAAQQALVTPAEALAHVPALTVPPERIRDVQSGKLLPWTAFGVDAPPVADGPVRLVQGDGRLLALVTAGAGEPGGGPEDRPDPSPEVGDAGDAGHVSDVGDRSGAGRAPGALRYLRVFAYDLTNPAASSNLSASSGRATSRPGRPRR